MNISLNPQAVTFAKRLIREGNIEHDEDHGAAHNPSTADENTYLEGHHIEEYGNWHLGLDMSKREDAKARYKFPYGDFHAVHRDCLIAAKERAAQDGYEDIGNAADQLLKLLEKRP